jgi:serine phosphatase RsbU (regulator of sigma subunit)
MATALYLVHDPATGRVELASAGHLPPLRIDGRSAAYVELGDALSPPLGLAVDRRGSTTFELTSGAALVLFTDGLVEVTRNIDDGLEQLRRAAGETSADALERLLDELQGALSPVSRYRDDVALLALRRD